MSHTQKINIILVAGGRSAEHEVSVISAQNIAQALNKEKYNISIVGIDKNGHFQKLSLPTLLESKVISTPTENTSLSLIAKMNPLEEKMGGLETQKVVFPILHGSYGEDGTIQGLFKIMDVPFVGAGVLGSAIGMDKDVMKRILRDANIPIANFLTYRIYQKNDIIFPDIVATLGLPFFIKPANLGSSVGISKVKNETEFKEAIETAFTYDDKIIIEEGIEGRELECAVLGNNFPQASVVGEIKPTHEFYSYEAKYLDPNGAALYIPANIPIETTRKIQALAINTFKALECEGMARVDFFLKTNGEILVNEINTIPGFTTISMYPKLWAHSGLPYDQLLDQLIDLAIEKYNQKKKLKNNL